jgi:hypothetical protein
VHDDEIWKRDESSGDGRGRSDDGHAAISRTGAEAYDNVDVEAAYRY